MTASHAVLLDALQGLDDAAAIVDLPRGEVLHETAALRRLLDDAPPAPAPLRAWDAVLPGLHDGLRAAATGTHRQWSCGEQGAYAVRAAMLDERHALLRLRDERQQKREHLESLRRQLDDREQLLFTSRAVSVGEMGSTLAHELNQPIGAAANLLRGLRLRLSRRCNDAPSREELTAVERAIDQVMFAARIVARIREFTHTHAPRLEPVNFNTLVRSSAALLDWDLQRTGVSFSLHLPEAPLTVRGDEVMLQQVLVNLLRNAIDALRDQPPAQPEIVLTVQRQGDDAVASLRDNGCGMGSETERRLFVPFTSTKPSGMGIGLSICRSFIELHQGRLWFSRNAERGSTFHLSLPLHPQETPS